MSVEETPRNPNPGAYPVGSASTPTYNLPVDDYNALVARRKIEEETGTFLGNVGVTGTVDGPEQDPSVMPSLVREYGEEGDGPLSTEREDA
jgi:hypothetical protein